MPDKRFDGRDETVIDRDLPIIDAHHHLFDRPALRYLLDDYLADVGAGHKIVASAYCETQAFECSEGPQVLRPLGEIEFANGVAAMSASGRYGATRVCAAIVGYADLRHGEAIAPLLDRALEAAPGRFRGVRQVTIEHPSEEPFRYMTHPPPAGIMKSAGFHAAFKQLAVRRLSFDAAVFHHQLPDIAALAAAFPDTPIVLNHMGMAMALGANEQQRAGVFREWSDSLRLLARRPNVVCKVGGLGMPFWGFGFESRTDAIGYAELAAAWAPCRNGDRCVRRRALHDGKQFSPGRQIMRLRSVVERVKAYRAKLLELGKGCAFPRHRRACLSHACPGASRGCRQA